MCEYGLILLLLLHLVFVRRRCSSGVSEMIRLLRLEFVEANEIMQVS